MPASRPRYPTVVWVLLLVLGAFFLHGVTNYMTLLEVGYAFHELVFALLFLVIVAIPFRGGQWWAWWACWAVEIANVAYALTFGARDSTILARALVAAIALPILLLAAEPWFFGREAVGVRSMT